MRLNLLALLYTALLTHIVYEQPRYVVIHLGLSVIDPDHTHTTKEGKLIA